MSVKIRPLQATDREAWQVLWKGYQAFYKTNLDDVTDSLWERLMVNSLETPFCFVAEKNRQLLGFVQALTHGTTWSPNERVYLHDLYTVSEARGQGVGRALINAIYEEAKKRGCDQVYWLTQDFNEEGRRLYDKVAELTPFIKYAKKL